MTVKAKRKSIKVKSDGSFTRWCKQHGYGGVNCKCIRDAARRGGKIAKKAVFARNFAHKGCSLPKKGSRKKKSTRKRKRRR